MVTFDYIPSTRTVFVETGNDSGVKRDDCSKKDAIKIFNKFSEGGRIHLRYEFVRLTKVMNDTNIFNLLKNSNRVYNTVLYEDDNENRSLEYHVIEKYLDYDDKYNLYIVRDDGTELVMFLSVDELMRYTYLDDNILQIWSFTDKKEAESEAQRMSKELWIDSLSHRLGDIVDDSEFLSISELTEIIDMFTDMFTQNIDFAKRFIDLGIINDDEFNFYPNEVHLIGDPDFNELSKLRK